MSALQARIIAQLLTPEVMAAVDPALAGLGLDAPSRDRATFSECVTWVTMFGSTAGPFGGVGCAAMTTFRLTVVHSPVAMILFAANERQAQALSRRIRLFGIAQYAPAVLEDKDWTAFSKIKGFTYVPDGMI